MQDNGVEIFTPWTWGDGMYEAVHLFSRYGHVNRIESASTNDSLVSAYSSITNKGDSLTVIFVNRAEKVDQDIQLQLNNFDASTKFKTLTLAGITGETFVSHTNNALKEDAVTANIQGGSTNATSSTANKFSISLPAKSITAILLTTDTPKVVDAIKPKTTIRTAPKYGATSRFDTKGRNVSHTRTSPGYYILR
jgi:alpha-L-arabinofuranosidase